VQLFILRNNQQFGPYSIETVKIYVKQGKILKQDKAFLTQSPSDIKTVRLFLKQSKSKVKIPHQGGILTQFSDIGHSIVFPKSIFKKKEILSDKKLLILSIIGLAPAFLIRFTFSSYFTFYAIALYFSSIWGMFFYYLFQTAQVKVKTAVYIFFATQLFVILFINIQSIPGFDFIYSLTDSNILIYRMFGFIFGVGLLEEIIKALPLFLIAWKAKEPMIPQTMVFYGLISGIGFGVFEGVLYQTSINAELNYNDAFFMNVARLTSLPFLHAIWAGIAGYFICIFIPNVQKIIICLSYWHSSCASWLV